MKDFIPHLKLYLSIKKHYIDTHILLEGMERIGWKTLEDLQKKVKANSKEDDCTLYSDIITTYVDLLSGQFIIVYPEDPHAPLVCNGKTRKLITKVKI